MRFTDNASIATDTMVNDDILAGTDVSTGNDRKFTLANLAAWLLNKFNGLSLAGSNQTVKSALDSLNSNLTPTSMPITVNSDAITNATFNCYAVGDFLLINGYFRFAVTTVTTGATLFTLGNSKKFRARHYLPIMNANNEMIMAIECRENTDIARARIELNNLSTSLYYYVCAVVCIK